VIVSRGSDGAQRALHNFCLHRGTRMCDDALEAEPLVKNPRS